MVNITVTEMDDGKYYLIGARGLNFMEMLNLLSGKLEMNQRAQIGTHLLK